MISTALKEKIVEYAQLQYPKEACGLLVVVKGRRRFYPCRNLAEAADDYFELDPENYAAAEEAGEVVAVIHSHPFNRPVASMADQIACNRSGLPWYIVNPVTREWGEAMPNNYKPPLVGREYCWGALDCWSCVRDWYAETWQLDLPDWPRPKRTEWDQAPRFEELYEAAGFREVNLKNLQVGDALLMSIGASKLNHIAVYIGDQYVLHHLTGRLSSRDLLGDWLLKCTGKVLRHESR